MTCQEALQLAQADANRAYGDLSVYHPVVALGDNSWHIDFELKNPHLHGGGPHYIIDAVKGTVLKKRYAQ